jgi:hypothetical protein
LFLASICLKILSFSFILSLYMSSLVRYISYKEQKIGSWCLIQCTSLYLLIEELRLLTFKIIKSYVVTHVMMLFAYNACSLHNLHEVINISPHILKFILFL